MLKLCCGSGETISLPFCNMSEVNCLASLLFHKSAPMITKRINFMWIWIRLDLERGLDKVRIISSEEITWNEIFGFEDRLSIDTSNELSYIPQEVFLIYTLSSDTEFNTKCIQSRFCCNWFPTSIKDWHSSIINNCNFVTVKIYNREIISHILYFSITRLPRLVVFDCLTHLGFDLSHDWCELSGYIYGAL